MSTLEFEIREARLRAELFTRSLQEARNQENLSLKTLEEERSRWTKTFEEKTTLIDQLERELSHTVEALQTLPQNAERHDGLLPPTPPRAHRLSNTILENGNLHDNRFAGHENNAQNQFISPRNGNSSLVYEANEVQPLRTSHEFDEMARLIRKLQEENISLTSQLDKAKYDSNIKKHKIDQLEADIRRLEEDKRLQQAAIRDYDGKLSFRMQQVCSLEVVINKI